MKSGGNGTGDLERTWLSREMRHTQGSKQRSNSLWLVGHQDSSAHVSTLEWPAGKQALDGVWEGLVCPPASVRQDM